MKTYAILFLLLPFLLISNKSTAQIVEAGIVPTGGSYTDIIPDTTLQGEMLMGYPQPSEFLSLDLNTDQIDDIKITEVSFGGMGGGGTHCTISPLHNSIWIAGDTVITIHYPPPNFQPTPLYSLATSPIHERHVIDDQLFYYNVLTYVWDDGWTKTGMEPMPHVNIWDNKGDRYIGFKIFTPIDTIVGWIGIEVTRSGNIGSIGTKYSITIKDFASTVPPPSGIESQRKSHHITISPNPSTGICSLSLKQENLPQNPDNTSLTSLEVFDLTGKMVCQNQQTLLQPASINLPATLNLSHLPEGMYFVSWKSKNQQGTEKLLIIK